MLQRIDRRQWMSHGICLTLGAGLGWWTTRLRSITGEARAEAADEMPEDRVRRLKLELPKPAPARATLVGAVKTGEWLYVSGHLPPARNGKPWVGKVGKEFDVKQAREAAHGIGLVVLGVVREQLGSLNNVARLVKTLGMVNCTPDFIQQPQVINAFSELMIQVFGETNGKGARSAVGMASLPNGAPVEIECIFQVKP